MGAYHHILTPFEISIEDNSELEKQFMNVYGNDFVLKSSNYIERYSPTLPNGQRLDFSYNEKTFALPEEIIKSEFSDFTIAFFKEWKMLYETKFKGKFYTQQPSDKELELQISAISALLNRYTLDNRDLRDEISDLEENYYFSIEGIIPQVVYQGYPLKTKQHTSLSALNFMHSYEKIGLYPDEYAAMFMLVDKMKEKYSSQFVIAKYLFIAGY